MNYIYWNIRGIGNQESQLHLFQLTSTHKPDFIFIAEPLVCYHTIPAWYSQRLHLQNHVVNDKNTLWCLWNNQHSVNILASTDQCIAFSYMADGSLIFTTAIYASTVYTSRRDIWLLLTKLLNDHPGKWLFIGDFNCVLGAHERLSGRLPLHISCAEFMNWSKTNSLLHLDTHGARFTWTNQRDGRAFMAQRIDRAICNEEWLDYWNVSSCNTLVKSFFDHFPLLMTMHKNPPIIVIPRFKFFKVWTEFESCESILAAHWLIPSADTPVHVLHFKLKSLKPKLKQWNKTVVGDFHQQVHLAQQQLSEAQLAIDQLGYNNDRAMEEVSCLTNYSNAINMLNKFWQDKNKNARFIEGNRIREAKRSQK